MNAWEGDLFRVKRFTEKPDQEKAEDFVAAGNYFWNSGMFMWSVRTLAHALREHFPEDRTLSGRDRGSLRHAKFDAKFAGFIRNAKTSASITQCWSHAQPKASRTSNLYLPARRFRME